VPIHCGSKGFRLEERGPIVATMLSEGTAAPDFETENLRGEPLRLSALRGEPVWLAFFRFASCPLCNYRVHEMIERWSMFEGRGFHLVGVFQSPAQRLRDFVATQDPPFTLVADPEMKLYALYGLESSILGAMTPNVVATGARAATTRGIKLLGVPDGPAMRLPGDYLIDRRGVIRTVYKGKDIADHLPLEVADRFLKQQGV
jgi:peroxiredoxin